MSNAVIESLFGQLEAALEREAAAPFFSEENRVYIYGAGNVGKEVFRLLAGQGFRVAGFLDRGAKPGQAWEGTPVLVPDDPAIPAADRKRIHALIAIFNCECEVAPIQKQLASLGYGQVTSYLDFHARFAAGLGDRYWLTSRRFYLEHREEITAAYELWSDETSRQTYASILKYRFLQDEAVLPAPSREDQYFPEGLPTWPKPVRIVDCGAYDGDTLRQLAARNFQIEAIAAFEPDPANFQKLAQVVPSLITNPAATACLFPCGVSSAIRQLRFSAGLGRASRAAEDGDTVIQCVALDEALPAFRPTLIKMDIEGAEEEALLGARRMIERYQPGLAVCLYHRPDHLWRLPLLAREWLRGGHHALRSHANQGFDLVYYWMP
jgi:FkbM family methyltransferase